METLIKEGQALLALGYGDVKNFSEEEVLQWTAASLREGGEGDDMIQKAVKVMREGRVRGGSLVTLTYDMLKQGGIPMGPASNLANCIQSLQAKKAARRSKGFFLF